jgi:hypothetical protein
MKKTKLYLPPKCEVVKVRIEQQLLASSINQGPCVETMEGYDDEEIDW